MTTTDTQVGDQWGAWTAWSGGQNPAPGQLVDLEIGCVTMVNSLSDLLGDGWKDRGRYRIAHPPTTYEGVEDALKDPATVHINMLRGGIAKPTPTSIGHLYRGADAVEVVAEVRRQNPDAFATYDGMRCQKCGGEIQGWTCQGCGQVFSENEAGNLVFATYEGEGLREKVVGLILDWLDERDIASVDGDEGLADAILQALPTPEGGGERP